ncbi:major capsid protein [Desulfovibrio sp.]|uniref:major capsid protein n=1 Tax=Desulfovibrio sp. TaxID=885 RepID=UPI0023C26429|nr:hypothetical protein [Desulfovibrio sp.]MDE7241372.1 hypothetical protein [Desulfovibrio sp.]
MTKQKGLVATLAELEDFYKGEPAGDVIELMNQTNDILSDVQWMESNQSDGHLTRIRTGLPEVYWRRLYQGTPPSKSQWSQVKEQCGMLEARMELDLAEIELYGDKARAFRLSEALAFAESMRQKVARTLFYGDSNVNPDEFNGLAMRYPGKTSPHVLDAGGTGSKCTSAWLVCWGSNTCHGLYPKGSTGGLKNKDLGEYMTTDEAGRKFQCVGDLYTWRCGLAVRDWRAVVRLANIDSSKLMLRKGETGFVDLQALTVRAKNMMPENMRGQAVWYVNQDVLTALELQSTDAGNVHLTYGEYFASKSVPALHGRPIRQCDVITSTEKALA